MKLLVEPIFRDLDHLYTGDLGSVKFKAKLVLATFDLPAKSSVLFNGEFGCTVCYHPGLRLSNGARV